jgi:hypothetical protein
VEEANVVVVVEVDMVVVDFVAPVVVCEVVVVNVVVATITMMVQQQQCQHLLVYRIHRQHRLLCRRTAFPNSVHHK